MHIKNIEFATIINFYPGDVVAVRLTNQELQKRIGTIDDWDNIPDYLWILGKVKAVRNNGIDIKFNGDKKSTTFSDTERSAQYTITNHSIRTLSAKKIKNLSQQYPNEGWATDSTEYFSSDEIDLVADDLQLQRKAEDILPVEDNWLRELKLKNNRVNPKIMPKDIYSKSKVMGQWIQITTGKNRGWSGFFIGCSFGVDDRIDGCGDYTGKPVYWFYLDLQSHGDENPQGKPYCIFLQQPTQYEDSKSIINQLSKWIKQFGTGERQVSYKIFVKARKRLKQFEGS